MIDAAVALDPQGLRWSGRSMRKNFNIASNLGMANARGPAVHPAAGDREPPDERVVVIFHR